MVQTNSRSAFARGSLSAGEAGGAASFRLVGPGRTGGAQTGAGSRCHGSGCTLYARIATRITRCTGFARSASGTAASVGEGPGGAVRACGRARPGIFPRGASLADLDAKLVLSVPRSGRAGRASAGVACVRDGAEWAGWAVGLAQIDGWRRGAMAMARGEVMLFCPALITHREHHDSHTVIFTQ